MSNFYLLSAIVIALSPLILFSKRSKKIREKHPEFINYYLTVIATFVGAFLAIYFSVDQNDIEKRIKTTKIIKACIVDLDQTINDATHAKTIFRNDSKTDTCCVDFFRQNPVRTTSVLNGSLQNDNMLETISLESIGFLLSWSQNFEGIRNSINLKKQSNFHYLMKLQELKVVLETIKSMLLFELKVQAKQIPKDSLVAHLNKLNQEALKKLQSSN